MDSVVKEQNSWGSQKTLSLDASIALSAVAALGSLAVADSDLAATFAIPLGGAVLASIVVILLRDKKQKQDPDR